MKLITLITFCVFLFLGKIHAEDQKSGPSLKEKIEILNGMRNASDDSIYAFMIGENTFAQTAELIEIGVRGYVNHFKTFGYETRPIIDIRVDEVASTLSGQFGGGGTLAFYQQNDLQWLYDRIKSNELTPGKTFAEIAKRHTADDQKKRDERQRKWEAEQANIAAKNKEANDQLIRQVLFYKELNVLNPVLEDIASNGIHITEATTPSLWKKVESVTINAKSVYVDGNSILVYGNDGCHFSTDNGESWTSFGSSFQNAWLHNGKGYGLTIDGEIQSLEGFSYSSNQDFPVFYQAVPSGDFIFAKSKSKVFVIKYNADGSLSLGSKIDSSESQRILSTYSEGVPSVRAYDYTTRKVVSYGSDGTRSDIDLDVLKNSRYTNTQGFRVPESSCKQAINATGPNDNFNRIASSFGATPIGNIWYFRSDGMIISASNEVYFIGGPVGNDWKNGKIGSVTLYFADGKSHPANTSLPDGTRAVGANDKRLFAVGKDGIWITDRN